MVLLISYVLLAFACTTLYPTIGTVSAMKPDRMHIKALQRKAADRVNKNRLVVAVDSDSVRSSSGVKNFTFSNPAASGQLSRARNDGWAVLTEEYSVLRRWNDDPGC